MNFLLLQFTLSVFIVVFLKVFSDSISVCAACTVFLSEGLFANTCEDLDFSRQLSGMAAN